MLNVLFLCTGNSCRSIMAEGILNALGQGRFRAYSAGSFPTGKVHPQSVATLKGHGIATSGYASKSWDVFAKVDFHIVITVCDSAAGETCPVFPGHPVKVHWSTPDPVHVHGTPEEIASEFDRVYGLLERRIAALVALPAEQLAGPELAKALSGIA